MTLFVAVASCDVATAIILIKAGVTQLFEDDLTFQAENNSSASRVVINRPFGPASSKSLIFVSKHATEFGPK